MYYFLAILIVTDLGLTLTMMLNVLGVLWLDHREISHRACYFQVPIWSIHCLLWSLESLLVMAYDSLIAISIPLRYTSILTNAKVMKIVLWVLMRGFHPHCAHNHHPFWIPPQQIPVLSHAFCLHQDVISLACANFTLRDWIHNPDLIN